MYVRVKAASTVLGFKAAPRLKDRSGRLGKVKSKKKGEKKCASFRRRHSTQLRKRKRGISGFFFKTRVGGREEHLISPQLTCVWWAWLNAVHRLCHEFPQEEQNTFWAHNPGDHVKVFKGRTGRSRQSLHWDTQERDYLAQLLRLIASHIQPADGVWLQRNVTCDPSRQTHQRWEMGRVTHFSWLIRHLVKVLVYQFLLFVSAGHCYLFSK